MEDHLKKKTISELKELCKAFEVKVSGSKDTIVQKLISSLQISEKSDLLSHHFPSDLISSMKSLPTIIYSCCKKPSIAGGEIVCSNCQEHQHKRCVLENSKLQPYLCPSCILNKLSPLEPVTETLLHSFKFIQNKTTGPSCEIDELSFEFPKEKRSEVFSAGGTAQIQARCIRMDGKSLTQVWPIKGFLIINEKFAMKFETSSNPNARKRKDEPLNVTMIVNEGFNSISLIVLNDPNTYFMSLVMVRRKTEADFIREIKEKCAFSVDSSKEFIRNTLRQGDPEVPASSIRFSLKCPMTMTIIKMPVRGVTCTHIQCFNLEPYVYMQNTSKVNRWKCPICKEYVYEMMYDLYLKEIVDTADAGREKGCDVEIYPNGEFKIIEDEEGNKKNGDLPLKRKIESHSEITKMQKVNDISVIDLDND